MENFIELNRLFSPISSYQNNVVKNDDVDLDRFDRFQVLNSLNWNELLKEHRSIILAESGAGKTQEIRHATQTLRADGKFAFFMRIEHVADDLESAFEIGTYDEFKNWLNSNEEGWLLLDSVDEARLKDPKNFERAVRKLASRLSAATLRTHLFITSRITAWRPKSDLTFCNAQFPYSPPYLEEDKNNIDGNDFSDESISSLLKNKSISTDHQRSSGFKVYSLADLTSEQISTFVKTRGVETSVEFIRELERQDAWVYTTRPQDLEELLEFWSSNGRIGTRFELMEHSVKRRLEERDQDRADYRPFTVEKARKGARLLASASVLIRESVFQVPDGSNKSKGISVKTILTDWNDREIQTLLSRPLFDEAIYGTVRFHHRSVREYLAAEWFAEELMTTGSRRKIEQLFFRTQYGQEVVIPSMRPVLSWLVLFDSELLLKVYNLEPELILEGGDPGKVSLKLRKNILASVCQKIHSASFYRSFKERVAVQRFASTDLVYDIISLLEEYRRNTNVTTYLLNLVWQGQMKEALPAALSFALDHTAETYTRKSSIRVIKEMGTKADLNAVCAHLLSEGDRHDRRLLAEIVDSVDTSPESVDWLLKVLVNTPDEEKYGSDSLGYSLMNFVNRADLDAVASLITGIDSLLRRQPVIEPRYCEVSDQYGWLLNVSIKAIEKLTINRHPAVFTSASLFALTQIPTFNQFGDSKSWSPDHDLPALTSQWAELNHALFWKDVELTRNDYERHEKKTLTDVWPVYVFEGYWKFTGNDFLIITTDISCRPLMDDRLVALSQAFKLYRENGSSVDWLDSLNQVVAGEFALMERLDVLLHPPAPSEEVKKFFEKETQRKKKQVEAEEKRRQSHADSSNWLSKNYEILRFNGLKKGIISKAQYSMYQRMVSLDRTKSANHQDGNNWQGLTNDYGTEVTTAFRDGLLQFWRTYTPALKSEDSEETNSNLIKFGLAGLAVESHETPGWPQDLSQEEAEIACRYAFREWGNFPNWFPKLCNIYPYLVSQLAIREICWELSIENSRETQHYILAKVSYSGEWTFDTLAVSVLEMLEKEPTNIENLKYLLRIVQRSATISDTDLARLSERKCNTLMSEHISYWYATWLSLEPEKAIQSFSDRLVTIHARDQQEAKNITMLTSVALLGGRRLRSSVRETLKSPTHLMELYLLMLQYIRIEEDIDRANSGVYSSGLRDDAQDARNNLLSELETIPGKEAYLCLVELSKRHPADNYRGWMKQSAKQRAEIDADNLPWTADQFSDFAKRLECTPTTHRELFDLGVQRLLDLKHSLEESDDSIASTLIKEDEETGIRKVIANWCRSRSFGRYLITQEEELADAKRPDCRFHSSLFDAPVPVELKLADNWSGPELLERLDNQLCGDYLRDNQSSRGIFLLVYRGKKPSWQLPDSKHKMTFSELIESLRVHWVELSASYPKIEHIAVIGIDLTRRTNRVQASKKKTVTK